MNAHSTRIPYSIPTLVGMACILLIMGTPLISACDSGGSNGGNTSSDALIPIEDGNRWEATVSGGLSGSATAEATSGEQLDLTLNVNGEERNGTLRVSEQSGGGLTLESLQAGEEETDMMHFEYPVEAGDSYQHTDGDGTTYDVSVSRTSVTVPAGEYENCLQYTIRWADSGNLNSTVVIKPGLGVVQWDGGEGNTVYELTSTNVDG